MELDEAIAALLELLKGGRGSRYGYDLCPDYLSRFGANGAITAALAGAGNATRI